MKAQLPTLIETTGLRSNILHRYWTSSSLNLKASHGLSIPFLGLIPVSVELCSVVMVSYFSAMY